MRENITYEVTHIYLDRELKLFDQHGLIIVHQRITISLHLMNLILKITIQEVTVQVTSYGESMVDFGIQPKLSVLLMCRSSLEKSLVELKITSF